MTRPVVEVSNLRVVLDGAGVDIVDEISFAISSGEVLGLVGESGSGKTTVGLALLGHCRRGARLDGGTVTIEGKEILRLPPAELQRLRGRVVAYIPQDPSAALNPALRIRVQLGEMLSEQGQPGRERLREVMEEVRLPYEAEFLARYPHQLSGGQQQRVALAMAFACRPRLIVLDEPTTGLDVTTQAHVLETVRDLCRSHGVAAVYVSHDLAVVAGLADRVAVMYAGRIVEAGPRDELFFAPRHPYTQRLIRAVPDVAGRRTLVGIRGHAPSPAERPRGCSFGLRCEFAKEECGQALPPLTPIGAEHDVRCIRAAEIGLPPAPDAVPAALGRHPATEDSVLAVTGLGARHHSKAVLFDVNLALAPRECLALVGESGSGKTTLARCVVGLHPDFVGEVHLNGDVLAHGARERVQETRRLVQYIFQSPYASLNPRKTVGEIVARPLRLFFDMDHAAARRRAAEVLTRVALSAGTAGRYPDQLSGGERQRVAIARALAAEPAVLICDEITSALDVSVQAAIVELLGRLQKEMDLSILFITHNLALTRTIAERVAVISEGRIMEVGRVEDVFSSPRTDYTRKLMANTPRLAAEPETAAS
jgi:peptide/nickel transport system ATP-binding protein